MIARAADMAEVVLADGMDAAMNRFHARPPNERHHRHRMSGATALDRALLRAPALAAAAARLAGGEEAGPVALARPAWPFALAALSRETGRALLVVAPGDDEARDLAAEMGAVLGRGPIALWPTRGVPAGGAVGPSPTWWACGRGRSRPSGAPGRW